MMHQVAGGEQSANGRAYRPSCGYPYLLVIVDMTLLIQT